MEEQRKEKRILLKGALYGALTMFLAGVLVLAGLTATGTVSIHTGAIQAGTTRKAEQISGRLSRSSFSTYDIKNEDLQNMSLKGYVAGLGDPYSVYYDPEETKEFLLRRKGNMQGLVL